MKRRYLLVKGAQILFHCAWVIIAIPPFLNAQTDSPSAISFGEKIVLESEVLGESREIFVYVPPEYWDRPGEDQPYPVMYVLDGESQFQIAAATVGFLSDAGAGNDHIPRMIVVGIPNTNRNRDLTPFSGVIGNDPSTRKVTGGGPAFLEFITRELIPHIDSSYHVSGHRTIVGHSLGGLIALEALLTWSRYFTNYLVIDPFLRYDGESFMREVIEQLDKSDFTDKRLFVATANTFPTNVTFRGLKSDTSEIVKLTRSNLRFQEIGKEAEWKIDYRNVYYPDENHFSVPLLATKEGLLFCFDYYPFPEIINYYHPDYRDSVQLVDRLMDHYGRISEVMGYEVRPMRGYLNSWAFGLSQFERQNLAVEMFDLNLRLYPNSPYALNGKAYFLLGEGKKEEALLLFQRSLELQQQPWLKDLISSLMEEGN